MGTRTAGAAEAAGLPQPPSDADFVLLEHDRIWFPSYPYEWPPEMLHAAGKLTIDLAVSLLDEGFQLKDASPFNVLYEGPRPVFIDICSFETRAPGDFVWLACAQFERTFLLPLLANRHLGVDTGQALLNRRDGLSPAELYAWSSTLQKLRAGFFSLVSMPVWLDRVTKDRAAKPAAPAATRQTDPQKALWIMRNTLRRTAKLLESLKPRSRSSVWTGYAPDAGQFEEKTAWVGQMLDRCAPKTVLDVGCNRGDFSAMAAKRGARVVALDSDPAVAGQVWMRATQEGLDIQPLAVNFARPTPATGWRNAENYSFLDRCRGAFDLILFLAVIHHIIAADRVPFAEIFDLAAECTTRWIVIEFINTADPMFQRLIRHREKYFDHYTEDAFVAASAARFQIVERKALPGGTRVVYLMEKVSRP